MELFYHIQILFDIDPEKVKQKAIIIDSNSMQIGKSFSLDVNYESNTKILLKKVK